MTHYYIITESGEEILEKSAPSPWIVPFSWQIAIFSEAVKYLLTACRAIQALRLLQVSMMAFALEQK